MKILNNNKSNKLLFVNSNKVNLDYVVANLVQLGSEGIISLPVTVEYSDCFTVSFEIYLPENHLQNATYLLRVLNSDDIVLFSSTVRVEGNNEENRSYVVLDKDTVVNLFDSSITNNMTPTTYKISDQYRGDTFNGRTFTLKEGVDKNPINLTGVTILSQFRAGTVTGLVQRSLSIGNGITINDSLGGVFSIDAFTLNWSTGKYFYDIEITFPDGSVRTYVKGTLNVIQDVTDV